MPWSGSGNSSHLDVIRWILDEGIGHHWMVDYGHVGAHIRTWAALCQPSCQPSLRLLDFAV